MGKANSLFNVSKSGHCHLDGSADGTMEVIVKSHQTSDIFILDHDGNEVRRLNPNVHVTNGKDHNRSALTVADLDGDGQMEIIASMIL